MKKFVLAALAAVCVMAVSQQQASAWVNSRFGIGLNWERQSGGNNFGWGLWRNGQPPGPEAFGGAPGYGDQGPQYYGAPPSHHSYAAPAQGNFQAPAQPYAGQYSSPYQFATYPRETYYYPSSGYFYYGR